MRATPKIGTGPGGVGASPAEIGLTRRGRSCWHGGAGIGPGTGNGAHVAGTHITEVTKATTARLSAYPRLAMPLGFASRCHAVDPWAGVTNGATVRPKGIPGGAAG